jgi:hypothetical protein
VRWHIFINDEHVGTASVKSRGILATLEEQMAPWPIEFKLAPNVDVKIESEKFMVRRERLKHFDQEEQEREA